MHENLTNPHAHRSSSMPNYPPWLCVQIVLTVMLQQHLKYNPLKLCTDSTKGPLTLHLLPKCRPSWQGL